MAGIWVRSGTIALTSGSKKVTGTGTAWNSGLNKVTKGCALKHNNIDYEVDYVNSDTELYLVDTYTAATLSGQAYRIQVAVTDTIPELSSRIAQALAYWNGQGANLQLMMSGSGNVTLTFPDGTQVTIPAWGNMQPKDALLTAIANLTTSADKLFYATGADAVAMTTLSAKGRELIDDANASEMLTTLGVSTFIKSLLDDADAAAALGTLGITKASIAETNSRLATDKVVTPAGLNAVVPYAPTVNPTLDLDFAKQKFKYYAGAAGLVETSAMSPLITFTRSSIAKYFDAMGVLRDAAVDTPRIDYDPLTGECKGLLIEESRTNLLTHSSRFDASSWVRSFCRIEPSSSIAPDGTLTAQRIISTSTTGARVTQSITAAATTYTFYVFVKIDSVDNGAQISLYNNTTATWLSVQQFTTIAGAGIDVGNGFRRIALTVSSGIAVGNTITTYIYSDKSYGNISGSSIIAWCAQLEAGAFPTSCINSVDTWTARASTATYYDGNGVLQTAASGVARSAAYDYDVDGVLRPIGLLLENAATNMLLYSELFDNAIWVKSAASITANAAAGPDGTTTADKLVEDTSTDFHLVRQTVVASASTSYTYSIHAKVGERTNVLLATYDGITTLTALFNLSTGTVTSVDSGATAAIKKAGGGAYRCSITATSGASATSMRGATYLHNGVSLSYTGDGTSGIYVWGAQLAAGNYATSYIATTSSQATRAADTSTSAQATRAADNAIIDGVNFSQWAKQYEGSLSIEWDSSDADSATIASMSNGASSSNMIGTFFQPSSIYDSYVVKNESVLVSQSASDVYTKNIKNKTALTWGVGSAISTHNGLAPKLSSPTSMPYLTRLNIGRAAESVSDLLNGHIRSLKYFPKPLAAAELQAMTA